MMRQRKVVPVRIEGHVINVLGPLRAPVHILLVANDRRIYYSILHEEAAGWRWRCLQNGGNEQSTGFGYAFRQFASGEDRMLIAADCVTARQEVLQIEFPVWMDMGELIKIQLNASSLGRIEAFMRNWHGQSPEASTDARRGCPFD
jgi:hypothetical protein